MIIITTAIKTMFQRSQDTPEEQQTTVDTGKLILRSLQGNSSGQSSAAQRHDADAAADDADAAAAHLNAQDHRGRTPKIELKSRVILIQALLCSTITSST
jgi:hypothetical protein